MEDPMRNARLLTLALSAAALGAGVLAAPAASADTVTTTFAVTDGTLSIAAAATSTDLGSARLSSSGSTIAGALPKMTVNDDRGSTAGWTATVASTDFTATVSGVVHTIAAGNGRTYIPAGAGPTLVSGGAVATTTAIDWSTGVVLSGTGATLVTATTTSTNKVEYTPTLQIAIPSTAVAGNYSGTITHTVV
jgi:hypothetical protein